MGLFPDTAMPISDMAIPGPTITTARGQLNPNPTVITDTTDIPFTITLMPMPLLTLPLPLLLTVLLKFIPVVQLHPFQEVPKVWENKVFFLSNCTIKNNKKPPPFLKKKKKKKKKKK